MDLWTRLRRSWHRVTGAVATEWRELGRLGRIGLVGVALSAGVAVVLGLTITASARGHLLQARGELISVVADDLAERGLIPLENSATPPDLAPLDEAVRLRLLGGESVRVKVWHPDGTIIYSDATPLIGQRFQLGPTARRALASGEVAVGFPDVSEPQNVYERGLGPLIEHYVPVRDETGTPVALFEVYQQATALDQVLGRIRRSVWASIGTGLLVLGVFMASLTTANARALNSRRRQAERLLRSLVRAQDEERQRIVGALHDDIGQPLYRLHYGLEGCRGRLPDDDELHGELTRLQELVKQVDRTLRGELRSLHHGLAEDLDLKRGLEELAKTTRGETELTVTLSIDEGVDVDSVTRSALLRAAQEGLTNARKHAAAETVSIEVREQGPRLLLEIVDDGVGWRGEEGLGLATTRERLEAIGGGLSIGRRNRDGTVMRAWVRP